MAQKHTLEELNNCSREELITIVLMMQGQLDALNDNIEKLIERLGEKYNKHSLFVKCKNCRFLIVSAFQCINLFFS